MDRESTAQNPTEGTVPVKHAMLALKVRCSPLLVGSDFISHPFSVRIMNATQPLLRVVVDLAFLVAQHGLPARRVINATGNKVPVPQTVVGSLGGQRVAFFAFF